MTAMTSSLEERIDRIESEGEIAKLIHRYAALIRADRPDEVAALFVSEGSFDIRDGDPDRPDFTQRSMLKGRDAIHAYLAPNKGQPHPLPLIHNLTVEVTGDEGSANCVMEARMYGGTHQVIGEYHDRFRREGGQWYFLSRRYTIFRRGSSI